MLTLWTRIRSMQRIHGDYIKTFLLGQHPSFVYRRLPYIPENEIPVYAFHNISAGTFENQIKYLAENNYRSIGADELYAVIRNGRSKQDKIVALTFDDGLKSLYDVAWPILKKYDFTGISFIAPGRILDKRNPAEDKTIADQFCSWDEIAQMHESGIFDFQSHTMHHHTVFSSSRCLGFANPMV
ncbi:MAG: polysaccharide deacetylase family protein, partial [Desulfobacterales bacterium]|nr:polysaccharide deacetylase family protein [Desulfobacterales bacterium]